MLKYWLAIADGLREVRAHIKATRDSREQTAQLRLWELTVTVICRQIAAVSGTFKPEKWKAYIRE